MPLKWTSSSLLVDLHAFFTEFFNFLFLNSKRGGGTNYISWKSDISEEIHHNKAFIFLFLIQMLIKEIALGTYATVLPIFKRICKY